MSQVKLSTNETSLPAIAETVVELARTASLEANVHDTHHLEECRELVSPGTRMYVSHLPKQRWEQTCSTSAAVRAAGYTPVPHIPVRLIENTQALHRLLDVLVTQAQIKEVLLIAGDYPQSIGPYASVTEVLRTFPLAQYGINAVSLAGHPEGHPDVALELIRDAEREKCELAQSLGLKSRLVTQFFFEAEPFVDWARAQRQQQVSAERIAGIAGPASIAALFKFALRCGVGPSMRALGVRPGALLKLLGDYTPDDLLLALAKVKLQEPLLFDGLHLFCFGGLLRTCQWLQAVARGQFELDAVKGLHVRI